MTRLWRLLAMAAALNLTAGAALAAAQTVLVRKAPPATTVELLLNDAVVGTGTTNPEGELSLDLKMTQPELDANVYVDVCAKSRRVMVVDHNRRPPAAPADCERRDISGIFWVRPINTLVVDVGGTQPSMLLIRGAYKPPKPEAAEGEGESGPKFETPTGLTLFGAGGFGKFRDAILVACGNVPCDANDGGLGYSFGGGFWFTPWLGAQGGYTKPRRVSARGGEGFTFDSQFDVDIFNAAAVIGVPAGRGRVYGLVGASFHQSTTNLSETIDSATQVFLQKTHGWGLLYGAGLEVWATPKVALFGEMSLAKVKGSAEDKGDGRVDDSLRFISVGVKIRLSR
jgi:hypothetical protein